MNVFKRRVGFQYRLSTLMMAMILIAVAASAYGYRLRAHQRQEQAFRSIAQKGGWIYVWRDGTRIYFSGPIHLFCGVGLERVVDGASAGGKFADRDLTLLDNVNDLRFVDFAATSVSPRAVENFRRSHPKCDCP